MFTRYSAGRLGLCVIWALGMGTGCLAKPKQSYSTEQLKQVESLEEIMRVQAEAADPLFAKTGQASFSDGDFAAMILLAHKLETTAESLKTRFSQNRPPSFGTYAGRMGEQATELFNSAHTKDAAKASLALTGIRETCRTCHKEHR